MKGLIKGLLRRAGYQLTRITNSEIDPAVAGLDDLTDREREIIRMSSPFTMTGPARLAAVVEAVKYLVRHRVPGDLAECGVWRGGSMMVAAATLLELGDTSRHLFLFDTFEGMSEPTKRDCDLQGNSASELLKRDLPGTGIWACASLDEVKKNLQSTGYPYDKIVFVKGRVEETIPKNAPERLALLRLDTDWYESTSHELSHLYPRLSRHGVLIVDDYGHWQGARQAVDEFLTTLPEPAFLHRTDYTGRMKIKP